MPKLLDQPVLVEAAQTIDRLDIVAYHVDTAAKTIVCDVTARNEQAGGNTIYPRPPLVLNEAQVLIAMGEAAIGIASEAVRLLNGDGAADALRTAMLQHLDVVPLLYYNATRDALYARFSEGS